MKKLARIASMIAIVGLVSSVAYGMVARVTVTTPFTLGLDNNGNPTGNSDTEIRVKAIGFPDSGLIINRVKARNVVNASGKRAVFRDVPLVRLVDPLRIEDNPLITRNRFVFPKGRARKNNLVRFRGINISNPNQPPIEEPEDPR